LLLLLLLPPPPPPPPHAAPNMTLLPPIPNLQPLLQETLLRLF
jgi:hypothetical protein